MMINFRLSLVFIVVLTIGCKEEHWESRPESDRRSLL